MKVKIPESIKDVTLRQFQEIFLFSQKEGISDLEIKQEKIKIITGIDLQNASVSQSDFEYLIKSIDSALETPAAFQRQFTMNGVDYGFHPNLDKMTSGEYFDLMDYGDNPETLHNLMAILFRPIVSTDKFGNYKIAKYKGTDDAKELMKDMPLSLVNGALVFFFNLSKELQISIHKYLIQKEQKKVRRLRNFLIFGVGTRL